MADFTKNVVSVLTFVLFVAGTVFTGFGIFKSRDMGEKNIDEAFIIPSQVLNGLTVMFLLYLTSTSNFTPSYKLLIIVLLVGGMMIEIYLTSYADREAESIASYVFVALNFLVRAFFLVELIQGKWVSPIVQTAKPVQAAVKNAIKEVAAPVATPSPAPAPAPKETSKNELTDTVWSEIQSKWDKLRDNVKSKPEGLNPDTEREAWKTVIRPSKDSGRKDVKEILREAVGVMKDKEGNPIPLNTVDAIGGRKRS